MTQALDSSPSATNRQVQKLYTRQLQRAEKMFQKLYLHAMDAEKVPMTSSQINAAKSTIEPFVKKLSAFQEDNEKNKPVTSREILEAFTALMESNHKLIADILRTNPELKTVIIEEIDPSKMMPQGALENSIESRT